MNDQYMQDDINTLLHH